MGVVKQNNRFREALIAAHAAAIMGAANAYSSDILQDLLNNDVMIGNGKPRPNLHAVVEALLLDAFNSGFTSGRIIGFGEASSNEDVSDA